MGEWKVGQCANQLSNEPSHQLESRNTQILPRVDAVQVVDIVGFGNVERADAVPASNSGKVFAIAHSVVKAAVSNRWRGWMTGGDKQDSAVVNQVRVFDVRVGGEDGVDGDAIMLRDQTEIFTMPNGMIDAVVVLGRFCLDGYGGCQHHYQQDQQDRESELLYKP